MLLFDGICNLCNASVRFVLRHERDARLLFCPLNSATGAALLRANGLPPDYRESLVLWEDGELHTRSSAALRLARHLRAPWRWGRLFAALPRRWRDALYDFVAHRRYRWFGTTAAVCALPTAEHRARLLD